MSPSASKSQNSENNITTTTTNIITQLLQNNANNKIKVDSITIGATMVVASALCWIHPEKAPSVLFLLIALGVLIVDPTTSFAQPAASTMTTLTTDSLNYLVSEEHSQQTDDLLQALAAVTNRAFQSSTVLTQPIKEYMIATLTDDDLHNAFIDTLCSALIKASKDERLLEATLEMVRTAMVGALKNEVFMQEMTTALVGAMVKASKEDELTSSMLQVITQGVSKALEDERFVGELRGAIKDTLQDGALYRAGAKGMLSAAFGGGGTKKVDD